MTHRLPCQLDHVVIGARSLDEGRQFVGDLLGEAPREGGRHGAMGTHNALLGLGDGVYLEIIAIDPEGEAPQSPRWFSLDHDITREKLQHGPQLLTWVVRTDCIDRLSELDAYADADVKPMSRGSLRWQFAFSPDGRCFADGILPHVIQWDTDIHPAQALAGGHCRLSTLVATLADDQAVRETLSAMDLLGSIDCRADPGQAPSLAAEFTTPKGIVRL
ncbi:MAG: VOC family protein [Arenicellales bacterium]